MPSRSNDYNAVQDYLFSLKAGGVKFGIDRMRALARELDHPERITPCIHIAGTNGKGSTAAMVESILRAAGLKVGLYTSPHLVRLGERVQVNRRILTEEQILGYVAELRPLAAKLGETAPEDGPSFFEFMTAMAFLHFAREKCDVSVIEVGLGGRLDSTNIVSPEVSVITSIALDHCDMLGDTLEQIAAEKAGIVKTGVPVVMGRLPAAAEVVVREVAKQRGATVHSVSGRFPDGKLPSSSLEGRYQGINAAMATLVAELLSTRWPQLTPDVIARGLGSVSWPGRWQRMTVGGRHVVLDASHNGEGAVVLEGNLVEWIEEIGERPIVVVGVLGAARAAPLMQVLARHAAEIHLVVPSQSRACSQDDLAALIPGDFTGPVHRSEIATLFPEPGKLGIHGSNTPVLVTGSIYLLGEVLARLEPERGGNEGHLQDF